jgi:tripartite ATP-independent transporter DctM subunit
MPSPEVLGILGFVAMFVLLALGIHVGISMAVTGFFGCVLMLGFSRSLSQLVATPYFTVADYSFIVLPMFIMMGELAFQGGIGVLLYKVASKWLGRLPGGLAMATVAANALFGAISGSTLAATATFGKLAVPEMIRYNYDKKLATGVVASAGTLAVMIPPSGTMVIYCIMTEVSLGKLMMAGFVPGIIIAIVYMILIYFRVRFNPSLGPPIAEKPTWQERISSIRWLIPLMVIVIVMLGGIYIGIFSPVEAGAVGAFTVLIVVLARRSLSFSQFKNAIINTTLTTGMICLVLMGAMVFGKFLMLTNLPTHLLNWVSGLQIPPMGVLVVILVIYIILGCILDVPSMLVITLPIFFPLLAGLGFDGVWLGILVILEVEMGVITPPIGMNVFVLKSVVGDEVSIGDIFRGIVPFFYMDLLVMVILVAFPVLSLWLPSMMFS